MLVLVGSMEMCQEIGKYLTVRGYQNGKDLLYLAQSFDYLRFKLE